MDTFNIVFKQRVLPLEHIGDINGDLYRFSTVSIGVQIRPA